jgi:hypothetical protein
LYGDHRKRNLSKTSVKDSYCGDYILILRDPARKSANWTIMGKAILFKIRRDGLRESVFLYIVSFLFLPLIQFVCYYMVGITCFHCLLELFFSPESLCALCLPPYLELLCYVSLIFCLNTTYRADAPCVLEGTVSNYCNVSGLSETKIHQYPSFHQKNRRLPLTRNLLISPKESLEGKFRPFDISNSNIVSPEAHVGW